MAAEREVSLDPLLERLHLHLLEPHDLSLREGRKAEVGERRPAPERESLAQLLLRSFRLGGAQRSSSLFDKSAEPIEVELLRSDIEHVPARTTP